MHKSGCLCAGCSVESRKAMQINQRNKAAAERDVVRAADAWVDAPGESAADLVLTRAVLRLREWQIADRAARARRASGGMTT